MGAETRRIPIRKLRHWKQRFDKNAEFICRRPMTWDDGKDYPPGDPIPEGLAKNPTKLRRFWEAQFIELAEFEDPDVATGQLHEPNDDDDDWLAVNANDDDDDWLD